MKSFSLILIPIMVAAGSRDLATCRQFFRESSRSEELALAFNKHTAQYDSSPDPVLLGYRAASFFMLCNYASSPFTALKQFSKGKALLEAALSREPGNPELRALRFTIQANAPGFLGYDDNQEEDKYFLISFLEKNRDQPKDRELWQMVHEFLAASRNLSRGEQIQLQAMKKHD